MAFSDVLIYGFGIIVVVLLGVIVIIYNTLVSLKNNVGKAWADIDVLLEKRYDLIGKLVDVVKGYAKYEKSVLVQITNLRTAWSGVQDSTDATDKMSASNQISQGLRTLFANVENYPNLKADDTFLQLQKALVEIEGEIAGRREFYNDSVNEFNIKIKVVPYVFFSNAMGYKPFAFFQAADEAKNPVKVDLS